MTSHDKERDVRAHLKLRLKALGGELRKCSWFPRSHAPDELVLLPGQGRAFFAELKAPGKEPRTGQWREIWKLRASGMTVLILDSREAVDRALSQR